MDEEESFDKRFTQNLVAKTQEIKLNALTKLPDELGYKQEDLDAMKEKIQTATADQLDTFKKKLGKGIDVTKESTQTPASPVTIPSEKPAESYVTKAVETGALLGGSLVVLTQTDLDILKSEKEKIKANITGDFAAIKKVENSQGKLILE